MSASETLSKEKNKYMQPKIILTAKLSDILN